MHFNLHMMIIGQVELCVNWLFMFHLATSPLDGLFLIKVLDIWRMLTPLPAMGTTNTISYPYLCVASL